METPASKPALAFCAWIAYSKQKRKSGRMKIAFFMIVSFRAAYSYRFSAEAPYSFRDFQETPVHQI
jgi:hypothetical protein